VVEDLNELGRLADVNLAQTWAAMGRAMGAAVGGSDACPFVASGIDAAFFNGVFASGAVSDPDRVVRDATEFMSAQQVPWLLWVREGVDEELLDAGRRAGLGEAGGPPGMALASIASAPDRPRGLDIEVVTGRTDLDACRDLMARGFEMPVEFARRFLSEHTIADPGFVVVMGSVEGQPVSVALVSVTGSTAGIYNVATPAEHRRRGFGAAVTWAAIEEGAKLGCEHAVLQASELGAPVYREMGFVDVGRYVQLEGPVASG
jgi:GNAT superfamily N-acetyltransferase